MQTIKTRSTKISAFFFALLLSFSMIIPPTVNAQEAEDGDKVLRAGHCWLDGKPNCRKKKEGTECPTRNHCSAQSYITAIAGALTIGTAIDKM